MSTRPAMVPLQKKSNYGGERPSSTRKLEGLSPASQRRSPSQAGFSGQRVRRASGRTYIPHNTPLCRSLTASCTRKPATPTRGEPSIKPQRTVFDFRRSAHQDGGFPPRTPRKMRTPPDDFSSLQGAIRDSSRHRPFQDDAPRASSSGRGREAWSWNSYSCADLGSAMGQARRCRPDSPLLLPWRESQLPRPHLRCTQ
jgi:hypothetical protein